MSKSKKSKSAFLPRWFWAFLPLFYIIVLLILLVTVYFGCYSAALDRADEGDFLKADKLLFAKFVTRVHDELILEYVDAGVQMERGNYSAAAAGFDNLLIYRDAQYYAKESRYREAEYCLERYANGGDAKWLFSAAENYSTLSGLGFADSAARLEQTYIMMYGCGAELYRSGDYSGADALFCCVRDNLGSYRDTAGFLTLTSARTQLYRNYYESSDETLVDLEKIRNTIDAVKAIWDFEDAPQVLVCNNYLGCAFLNGCWRCEEDGGFFELRENDTGSGSYIYGSSLPHTGGKFRIENGVFFTQAGNSYTEQFKITVIEENLIEIFCARNGETYIMRR